MSELNPRENSEIQLITDNFQSPEVRSYNRALNMSNYLVNRLR